MKEFKFKNIAEAIEFMKSGAGMYKTRPYIEFGLFLESLNLPPEEEVVYCEAVWASEGCTHHILLRIKTPLPETERGLANDVVQTLFGGSSASFSTGTYDGFGFVSRMVR